MSEQDRLDAFKKTKYWRYLIEHFDEMDRGRLEFKRQFSTFIENKTDEMAVVLKSHLIVEHYIDQYIATAFPSIANTNKLNLRFSSKIEMINNPRTIFGYYSDSLKQLNSLRNKFAHNLEYTISDVDLSKMKEVMDTWNSAGGYELVTGMEVIRQYTMWISSSLDSTTRGIKKESKSLGIAGYVQWLQEMQKTEEST